MIYCFRGCTQVCLAPCTICGGACKECEQCFKPVLEQPLGCYVLLTWLCMLVQIGCGGLGLVGGGCGSVKIWSLGLAGFAVIHAGFAYYIQRRLMYNINKTGSTATGTALAREAGRMFLYDVGFCIYGILFIVAFCYGLFCMSQLSCSDGTPANSTWLLLGALLQILYNCAAFNYALCWYFGNCCLGGLQGGGRGGGQQGMTMPPPIGIGMAQPAR